LKTLSEILFVNILSINVAESAVMRVGLFINGKTYAKTDYQQIPELEHTHCSLISQC
jgi:hypothetical protein